MSLYSFFLLADRQCITIISIIIIIIIAIMKSSSL